MIKILSLSDLHIRLNERHDEYYEILSQLDNFKDIDYCIFAGDLFHDKSKLSPEAIRLASWFIKKLSKIAKKRVIIVVGNHDLNEKHNNRLDAISPLVEALKLSNVTLSVKSEIIEAKDITFVNYSIIDSNYNFILDEEIKELPTIGIYHGCLDGAITDQGFKLNGNKINLEICDAYCLGDIHLFQEISKNPLAVYNGSTICQNFGESEDKGGLIWTINSKDDIKYERFILDNPYIYKTIKLSEYESIKKDIKSTWKLRFVNDLDDNVKFEKATKDIIIEGFNLKQVVKNNISIKEDKLDLTNIKTLDNLNKIIKEKYIEKYKQYKEDIINLNSKYYNAVINSEVSSGVWTIKELRWDNLFNFAENNTLKFSEYKDNILLINGPNFSGKSSLISCITFAIFGNWTKSPAKYSDYVNKNKNSAYSHILIEKNKKLYSIERRLTLTNKTFKNSVHFINITDSKLLNGDDINETEKLIEKYFGTLENFKLTTLITQFDNLGFINEKSTKRKEILNQFLSLDFFKTIDNLVNKDLQEAKFKYQTNEQLQKEYDEFQKIDIKSLLDKDNKFQDDSANISMLVKPLKETISKYQENIKNISISKEIELLKKQEGELIWEYLDLKKLCEDLESDIDDLKSKINDGFSLKSFNDKRTLLYNENIQLVKTNLDIKPCNFDYPSCSFLVATKSRNDKIEENNKLIIQYDNWLIDFNVEEYNKLFIEEKETKQEFSLASKNKKTCQDKITSIQYKIKQLNPKNMSIITQQEYETALKSLEELNTKHNKDFNENQIIQFQINQYNKSKDKFDNLVKESDKLRYEYNLLNDYSEIIGKNGLPSLLINNYIDSISNIVTDIVSNILDLDVKLEINENKFNIYIKNKTEKEYRVIECGSGAEHFFVGLAIRLAFYKISNLVKSDLLIMDEPATSLDIIHQNKFGEFFEILNKYFGNVIVVTHLDLLKEYVTKSIDIKNKDGYARLD